MQRRNTVKNIRRKQDKEEAAEGGSSERGMRKHCRSNEQEEAGGVYKGGGRTRRKQDKEEAGEGRSRRRRMQYCLLILVLDFSSLV